MNTFNLRLDLDKSSQIQVVTLRQGDVDGTTIAATVYDHGALADLSGISSAYIEFALPDGTHYYRGAASVSGSVVTALVDESQAASVPGRACNAYFSLSDGTHEYSTASFVVAVLKDATSESAPAESYDDAIQDFIDAWLDEHPEATTTVQDGAISTAKLANGAVTDAKLAQTGGVLENLTHTQEVALNVIDCVGSYYRYAGTENPIRIAMQCLWLVAGSIVEYSGGAGFTYGVATYDKYVFRSYSTTDNEQNYAPTSDSGWIQTPRYVLPESGFVVITVRYYDDTVFTSLDECDGMLRVLTSKVEPPYELPKLVQRGTSSDMRDLDVHFSIGTLSSGRPVYTPWRVQTPIEFTSKCDLRLVANNGFRFGVHKYVNGEFSSDSGWQTSYAIPSGTTFKITIARNPDITGVTADIDEFVSNVKVYDEMQEALRDIGVTLPRNNWITSAHRGYVPSGSNLHENTLAAFYLAAENGAEMIELDARLTSDGVLISNHDATVTGKNSQGQTVTYTIANETAATICSVILSQDNTYGTQFVPTLEQVLNLAYNTGMDVNIDLKNGYSAAEQAAKTVWKCGMRGHVVYALNGSGMQAINKIIELDPQARFIDIPSNFTAEALASLDDYESRCFAYTSAISANVINGIRDSGCMLAIIGLTSSNFAAAIAYHPEMCEFPHTSDFRSIEMAYHDNRQLY